MDTRTHFVRFAHYNAWANSRLYKACATLDDDRRKAECGAFFKSIHNTLNHLLVVDRLWFGRFEGVDHGVRYLAEILYDDFDALWGAREDFDQRIIAFCDSLDPAAGDTEFRWAAKGQSFSGPFGLLLAHAFNHQTHHRGQLHALLTQAGAEAPPLDLWFWHLDQTGG